jgi:hypothetical protein
LNNKDNSEKLSGQTLPISKSSLAEKEGENR